MVDLTSRSPRSTLIRHRVPGPIATGEGRWLGHGPKSELQVITPPKVPTHETSRQTGGNRITLWALPERRYLVARHLDVRWKVAEGKDPRNSG